MRHLDDGVLHALLDGEVPSGEMAAVERHLSECEPCRQRMAEARAYRSEARGMLVELDQEPSMVVAESVVPWLGAPSAAPAPLTQAKSRPRFRPWIGVTALAAVTLLAVWVTRSQRPAAAELAAVPGPAESPTMTSTPSSPNRQPSPERSRPATPPVNAPRVEPKAKTDAANRADAEVPAPSARSAVAKPSAGLEAAKDERTVATGQLKKEAVSSAPENAKVTAPAAAPPAQSFAASKNAARDLMSGQAADTAPRLPATRLRTARDEPLAQTIGAGAAIAALGGSIRLVDGLTPARYERQGIVVRVIYQTAWGPLALEQWRAGNVLAHKLVGPPGAPDDSVGAWRERIR